MFAHDFDRLLERFDPQAAAMARQLVATVQAIRPDFTAKIAFGWGSVNFSWGKRGYVLAVYMSRTGNVALVFADGRLLDSPLLVDDGKVKKVRWIPFEPGDDIPVDDIAILIAEAVALRS